MKKNLFIFIFVFLFLLVGCSLVNFDNIANEDKTSTENNPSINEDVDFSKLTYCAYGDSITQMGYPKIIGTNLNLFHVDNKGIGGTKLCKSANNITDRVLSNFHNYDIISLMGGTNDYGSNFPLGTIDDKTSETIYGSLNIIAEHLTTNYPDSFIFFMTPLKRVDWEKENTSGYNLEAIANAVKDVCNKYDIACLDTFLLSDFNYESEEHTSDGLHPNTYFRDNHLAPQISNFIKNNYKKN